jgi:hypothetical protein
MLASWEPFMVSHTVFPLYFRPKPT